MMNRKGFPREMKKAASAHPESMKSSSRSTESAVPAGTRRTIPEKPDVTKDYKNTVRSYRFQRARTSGIIEVLNENSYVMAEYSERTGAVKWQRMVLASQREQIEKWLEAHYPKA